MLFGSFTSQGYRAISGQIATDRSVNLYPERGESGTTKAPFSLLGVPGIRTFRVLAGGPIRALASSIQGPGVNEYLLAIAGPNVYKVDGLAVATLLGTVAFAGGPGGQVLPAQILPCDVPGKTQAAFILSEGQGYIADIIANTITPVALPIGYASSATYLDTYAIISDVASRKFYISNVGDPSMWNALNVATKEAAPDFLQAVFAANELLWLFGLETTEIWYDSGAGNFPFVRYPGGGVLEVGTTFPYSIAKVGDAIMWVGREARGQYVVYMARGIQYQRVSNHAVEAMLNSSAYAGGGLAHSYDEQGHFFYVLNSYVPGGFATTLVYDLTTNMWHERAMWSGTAYSAEPWQYHTMAFYAGAQVPGSLGHYVGGTGNAADTQGIIYQQAMNLFDFDGAPKRCMRVAPHLTGEQRKVRYKNFILDLEKTSNPSLDLTSSNDGGVTFGNTHTVVAPNGQSRAIWRQLGSARDKVIQVSSQTACLQAWAAAYVNERAPAP